jgi:hypothetical protein
LGNEKIDTERRVLVLKMGLELVYGTLEELGTLANTANDTNTTL